MAGLDWQTVVVTAVAVGALAVVLRPLVPRWGRRGDHASCPSCASGQACAARPGPIAVAPPRGGPGGGPH
jgi:hypothetical protein